MSTPIAPPLSKIKIEQLTIEIRNKFMIFGCYFDIIRFMEFAMRAFDPSFDFECVEELPENTYAYYNPLTNKIMILGSVYDNACNGVGRDRFTIAHEIGHYFLHRNGFSFARTDRKVPTYSNPEWQANTFASFLLIPRNQTLYMSIEDIETKCGVSHQAAEIAFKRNWQ